MLHSGANPTAPNIRPQPPHPRQYLVPHNSDDASQYTHLTPQGAINHHGGGHSSTSSQPLTERNLAEHNHQQKKQLSTNEHNDGSSEEYFAKLHQDHTTRILAAGQTLRIDQSEIQVERRMLNSQAATPMEWYLAEDKHRRHK